MNKAVAGTMYVGGADPACRQSHVGAEMDSLRRRTQALEETIETLFQRLESVLREEPPCPVSGNKELNDYVVPLAGGIRQERERLDRLDNRLGSLLNRLEV